MDQLTAEGFDDWYRRLHPRLATVLVGAVGDPELAREAADEAFARAYERWESVGGIGNPDGWAYRTALNVARRRERRRGIERRLLLRETPPAPFGEGPAGELWLLVAELPRRQREAVVLRHVGHQTEAEVAEALGVRRGTVSRLLGRAYERLQDELADETAGTGG